MQSICLERPLLGDLQDTIINNSKFQLTVRNNSKSTMLWQKEYGKRASKMTLWVEALSKESDNLTLISGTPQRREMTSVNCPLTM